jgi:excisionase family DNA binding protein
MSENLLRTTEVAERCSVSKCTVVDWINRGLLEAVDIGTGRHRAWRVAPSALAAFIESRTSKKPPAKQEVKKKRISVKEYV